MCLTRARARRCVWGQGDYRVDPHKLSVTIEAQDKREILSATSRSGLRGYFIDGTKVRLVRPAGGKKAAGSSWM